MKFKVASILLFFFLSYSLLAETVKLTVLQTTDIHCHMHNWLKLATVIKREQYKAGGPDSCLLVDCGDTIQGSLIASMSNGTIAVETMNLLAYDAWIIGNHEFDFGLANLNSLINQLNAVSLAANLKLEQANEKLKSWVMLDKKGCKIALIGLTAPFLNKYLWGKSLLGFKTQSYQKTLSKLMPQIMDAKPDVIILAAHHGDYPLSKSPENDLNKIAETYPQIDLILGGHNHQTIPGRRMGIRSWYVQAAKHGNSLAKINLEIDCKKHSVTNITSTLIDAEFEEKNKALKKTLYPYFAKYAIKSNRKIGATKNTIKPLSGNDLNASMNELFCLSIAETANAPIAFHSTIKYNYSLFGDISEYDLFKIIPYEDTVCTLELTEAELKNVIEEQVAMRDKGRFQSPFGIVAMINENGKVIGNLYLPDNQPLDKKKRYKTAFNSYVLAGAGSRFPYLKALAKQQSVSPHDTGISIRDSIRKYIKQHSPLSIKNTKWLTWERIKK